MNWELNSELTAHTVKYLLLVSYIGNVNLQSFLTFIEIWNTVDQLLHLSSSCRASLQLALKLSHHLLNTWLVWNDSFLSLGGQFAHITKFLLNFNHVILVSLLPFVKLVIKRNSRSQSIFVLNSLRYSKRNYFDYEFFLSLSLLFRTIILVLYAYSHTFLV